jgi:hypothetical protein
MSNRKRKKRDPTAKWISEDVCQYQFTGKSTCTILQKNDCVELVYDVPQEDGEVEQMNGYGQITKFIRNVKSDTIDIEFKWIYEKKDILNHCELEYDRKRMLAEMEQLNFEDDYAHTEHTDRFNINGIVGTVAGLSVEFKYDLDSKTLYRISDLSDTLIEAKKKENNDDDDCIKQQKYQPSLQEQQLRDFLLARPECIWQTTYGRQLWLFIEPCLSFGFNLPDNLFHTTVKPFLFHSNLFPTGKKISISKKRLVTHGNCGLCCLKRALTHSMEWSTFEYSIGPECFVKLAHLLSILSIVSRAYEWLKNRLEKESPQEIWKQCSICHSKLQKLYTVDRSKYMICEEEEILREHEDIKQSRDSTSKDNNDESNNETNDEKVEDDDEVALIPVQSFTFPRKETVETLDSNSNQKSVTTEETWEKAIQARSKRRK